jgi:DNA-binding CsgD family transcriptional regulator
MAPQLTSEQTQSLTDTIAALGSGRFGEALLGFIGLVVNFDSGVVIAYPAAAKLVLLEDQLAAGDRALFDGPYRNGLYLLSPLYVESRAGRRGCFHISDIAPEGFTDGEFYQLYYSTNGSIDQVAFLCETGHGTPIAISIERTESLPPFSSRERAALADVSDLISQLVRQQRWVDLVDTAAPPRDMHAHLENVLSLFGSSTLTPREREVVRLILRGYPSKSVARELNISTQTEQVHRKNIYQKLGISSHSELFTLFFDAIAQPAAGTDPLLALRA